MYVDTVIEMCPPEFSRGWQRREWKKLMTDYSAPNLIRFLGLCYLSVTWQISFRQGRGSNSADHDFTLRTLIDKYVHYHKEKVYACFVDFRKAFDSVWHEGLFYKLLKTNIGGNLYNLMKSLYCNSTCSIKIGENKTQPFSYSRGVRQGCILSPLLFNLYLNNLPHLFENTLSDPFVLPNGKKIN